MKIQFLGTAAAEGVPAVFCDCDVCKKARALGGREIRTRSQAVINDELLIDLPADTYFHIIRDGLDMSKIRHCLITHSHPDHFYPTELSNRSSRYSHLADNSPFNLYASGDAIDKMMSKEKDLLQSVIDEGVLVCHTASPFKALRVMDYIITPLMADHARGETALCYMIEHKGKTLLYGHDTGYFPDETWAWFDENKPHIDFVTLDCCYGLLPHRNNHMGIDTVCEVQGRLLQTGVADSNTVFCINHFSHNIGSNHTHLQEAAEKLGMLCSYDGLSIEF